MEKVSVVKCNSYKNEEVKRVLEESLKNIGFKFKKNMRILIKPNLLAAFEPEKAITTHPAVLEELCKILKKYNAEIYIGDSSAENTEKTLEICGINRLKKYAKIINFDKEEKDFFNLDKFKKVSLPKIIFRVDLIINIAKLKTHMLTGITLCTKNLFGCIPGENKANYHKIFPDPKIFSQFLVSLEKKIKPELNIIDGILGLEGNGPGSSGSLIKSNLILMAKKASAIDIIASEIMGFKWENIYTNKFSTIKKEDILIVGDGKNVTFAFDKPTTSRFIFLSHITKLLPKQKIAFFRDRCTKCHLCEKKCPTKAIKLGPWPECNSQDCISCLCCIEVCPNKAVYLRDKWIILFFKSGIKRLKSLFFNR